MSKQLEDRVTYVLSEWLNDNAPIGQERYRDPAKAVISEVLKDKEFLRAYLQGPVLPILPKEEA